MKYGIIDPEARTVHVVDCDHADDAYRIAGLDSGAVDHGTVTHGLAIVVSEYGLFEPPERQAYFSIDRQLYAGPAVLYAHDKAGHTVNYEFAGRWFGAWYADADAVEAAIAAGHIDRPQMAYGEHVVWQWPGPRPDMTQMQAHVTDALARGDTVVIDGDTVLKVQK